MFRIVQLSDLHCGQQFFLPQHLERAIAEVNEMEPDVVVISGDLTSNGFKDEYVLARDYLSLRQMVLDLVRPREAKYRRDCRHARTRRRAGHVRDGSGNERVGRSTED